jgi:hypothetical protein
VGANQVDFESAELTGRPEDFEWLGDKAGSCALCQGTSLLVPTSASK